MELPKIADTKPVRCELEPGDYFWCACGLSAGQPFCDGSHKGTGLAPVKFTVEEKRTAAVCCCKRTANAPFCDGAHKTL